MPAALTMPTAPRPVDREALGRRAREMIQQGRLTAARSLVAALRKLDAPDTDGLEGRILLAEGRFVEAVDLLDRAIAGTPDAAALWLCRADARIRCDDVSGAAADAAQAVLLDPGNTEAKAVLGMVLIELGRFEDAIACLREAILHAPRAPAYWQALAEAQERAGDPIAAAGALAIAIAAIPHSVALRTAAMMLAMRQRDFPAVTTLAAAARAAGAADACVFGLQGHALSNLGDHAAATEAYGEAHKLAPEDPYVQHLLRAAGMLPNAQRAPAEYLETVFDGYADRFEAHLLGLGYRAPGLIRAELLRLLAPDASAGHRLGPILDLGCGTGLMAVALSDQPVRELVGVDISAGMLQQAEAKSLYTGLARADILQFLAADERAWPIILAADVFCYFGALDAAMSACHARLEPGGLLLFTVEALEEGANPWRLGGQGRYRHAEGYVQRCLEQAGFGAPTIRAEILRLEGGAPVPGLLVTARRRGHDA